MQLQAYPATGHARRSPFGMGSNSGVGLGIPWVRGMGLAAWWMGGLVVLAGPVRDLCERYLGLVERELPVGLVTGVYLRGGVVFGEWAPRQSDVDFVATVARRLEAAEVEVLRGV